MRENYLHILTRKHLQTLLNQNEQCIFPMDKVWRMHCTLVAVHTSGEGSRVGRMVEGKFVFICINFYEGNLFMH